MDTEITEKYSSVKSNNGIGDKFLRNEFGSRGMVDGYNMGE